MAASLHTSLTRGLPCPGLGNAEASITLHYVVVPSGVLTAAKITSYLVPRSRSMICRHISLLLSLCAALRLEHFSLGHLPCISVQMQTLSQRLGWTGPPSGRRSDQSRCTAYAIADRSSGCWRLRGCSPWRSLARSRAAAVARGAPEVLACLTSMHGPSLAVLPCPALARGGLRAEHVAQQIPLQCVPTGY